MTLQKERFPKIIYCLKNFISIKKEARHLKKGNLPKPDQKTQGHSLERKFLEEPPNDNPFHPKNLHSEDNGHNATPLRYNFHHYDM